MTEKLYVDAIHTKHKWKNTIKTDIREKDCGIVNWIEVSMHRV
jgi:hypothetical protein